MRSQPGLFLPRCSAFPEAMRLERHGRATHDLYGQTRQAKRQHLPRFS